ncbi:MAG: rhodanese-like domain-containing protein [Candidatus Deferrimicrobium sp.]
MQGKKSILLAAVAVILTAVAVWFAQRPVTLKQTTWDDVLAEAKAGDYRIITTGELADRYRKDASGLLLVDTRQEWEYRTGHIKGALNFPMEPTWWARWRKAGDLRALLGPEKERGIVFY